MNKFYYTSFNSFIILARITLAPIIHRLHDILYIHGHPISRFCNEKRFCIQLGEASPLPFRESTVEAASDDGQCGHTSLRSRFSPLNTYTRSLLYPLSRIFLLSLYYFPLCYVFVPLFAFLYSVLLRRSNTDSFLAFSFF